MNIIIRSVSSDYNTCLTWDCKTANVDYSLYVYEKKGKYIYIYIYVCVCVCVCKCFIIDIEHHLTILQNTINVLYIYIYIYIYNKRFIVLTSSLVELMEDQILGRSYNEMGSNEEMP